jgi:HAD superfamily hydrolase (TIGR01549 family)
MVRAVLFDLDDTLIDSTRNYVKTIWRTCDELGLPRPAEALLKAGFVTWRDHVEAIFPEVVFETFASQYRIHAHEIPYPAIPGALDVLEELAHRQLGIVTNRDKGLCGLRMSQAGIDVSHFDFIHTVEDLPGAKPHPQALEPAVLQVAPLARDEILYVGDRPEDARVAQSAGIGFVAVLTGVMEAEAFAALGVSEACILDSVRELPNYLRNTRQTC